MTCDEVLGPMDSAYEYSSYLAVQMIDIGDILSRMEVVVAVFFIFTTFVKLSVLLYGTTLGLAQVLELRSYRPLIIPIGILMIILALTNVGSSTELYTFAGKAYPIYALPWTFGIPLLTLIVAKLRKLPDTCSTVEEAKEALLTNKHFYIFQPVHLLIADKFGNSFVWEYSHAHNKEFIVDGKDMPQIVTNFLLHRYKSIQDIPKASDEKACPYNRYSLLHEAINEHNERLSMDFIKETNALVFIEKSSFICPTEISVRTLLHSIYDIESRSLEVSFYLKDNIKQSSNTPSIRSSYFKFCLD